METIVNASLVLTVIGGDRPGLVESVSQAVAAHGGNWLGSRMARLAGQFAGILHVEVPADQVDALREALLTLEAKGLRIVVTASEEPETDVEMTEVELDLVGQDHPGIVRDISHLLAERGVNVDELETDCTDAPMSGETLFIARARLQLPASVSVEQLREDLEQLAHDLVVEVSLQRAEEG